MATTTDDLGYFAVRCIQAVASGEASQFEAVRRELRDARIDPVDVLAELAAITTRTLAADPNWRAAVDAKLTELELFRRLGMGEAVRDDG